jgi:hypothetical protein
VVDPSQGGFDPSLGVWPLQQRFTRWPVLHAARLEWDSARERIDALNVAEDERATLVPVLRRKAVLDAATQSTELHGWLGVPIVALLVFLPLIVVLAIDTYTTLGHLALIYLLYLPCLLIAVLVTVVAFAVVFFALDGRPRWLVSLCVLFLTSAITGGLALYLNHLRHDDAAFLLSLFTAVVCVLLTFAIVAADWPFASTRQRRRLGAQGVDHTAALVLFEEWEILLSHRRTWRTSKGRSELLRTMSELATIGPTRLDRSVRINSREKHARRWAATLAWHLCQSIRDHQHRLLQIDHQQQFDDLITVVTQQTLGLCQGSWTAIEHPGEAEPRPTILRRLARLVVPVTLTGAALGVRYVPGLNISPEALVTVRLSLIVPAILSLLPVKADSQQVLTSALRDALGRLKP